MYSAYGRKFTRERTGYTTDVNDPSLTWVNQEPHWLMIEDLAGGTYEIRMKHRR